jgi:broad specificity phosphatase PhoE
MFPTRFWLLRHALVDEPSRRILYGTMDVQVCAVALRDQAASLATLARVLPRPARWLVTPLSRTTATAEAIFAAGYPEAALVPEPAFIEQGLGDWQGLAHAELPARLTLKAHAFWPLAGLERPPGGESMGDVIARVGPRMEELAAAHAGEDVVIVTHGGTIRAAIAYAIDVGPDNALHLAVQNLSLTRLERHQDAWRVVCVNATGV